MNDPAAANPVKKKSNGCLIALGIAGGLLLVGALGVSLLIWGAVSSEKGKKVLKLAGGAIAMAQQAKDGPGTQQLRELGCSDAMVMDLASFRELVEQADGVDTEELQDDAVVVCAMEPGAGEAPGCAQVAATYLGAVPPPAGSFLVSVQRQGRGQPECTGRFDASGSALPLPPPTRSNPR